MDTVLWYKNSMVQIISWPRMALPQIHTAGKFQLEDRDFETQYQSRTHALHVYEYEAVIRLEGRSILLRPGDLTCTPAGVVTSYHVPHLGRHWCVHFLPAQGPDPVQLPQHLRLSAPLRQHVAETILRIAGLRAGSHGNHERAAVAEIAAGAQLQALMLELALAATRPAVAAATGASAHGRTAAALVRATTAIESQLSQSLDLDTVAKAAGLTRAWLAKAFHARHGVTLQRWHLQRRIDHARVLLRTTSLPVGTIAVRLGFLDAQHLNKQFRRIAGCSPTAYRAWAAPNDA